ncbi:MgtC/SapB family protein, partial [Candidatus Bathyarchaeota archaeon]|nr:MgtC/SapB family protein [Candidatus Bathyarchaeota archaeon]
MSEIELIARIGLSFILGGLIGFEREGVDKPAGLRTHILVSVGSTQLTILS